MVAKISIHHYHWACRHQKTLMIHLHVADALAISNCPKLQFGSSSHLIYRQWESNNICPCFDSTKNQSLCQEIIPQHKWGTRENGRRKSLQRKVYFDIPALRPSGLASRNTISKCLRADFIPQGLRISLQRVHFLKFGGSMSELKQAESHSQLWHWRNPRAKSEKHIVSIWNEILLKWVKAKCQFHPWNQGEAEKMWIRVSKASGTALKASQRIWTEFGKTWQISKTFKWRDIIKSVLQEDYTGDTEEDEVGRMGWWRTGDNSGVITYS